MIRSAEQADWIAFGLPVKLPEDRPYPLEPLHQPCRRHRRCPIKQKLKRRKIGIVEPRVVEHDIDHGRDHHGHVDPLARDRGKKFFGIEAFQQVHGSPAHQRWQDKTARNMGDRCRGKIARRVGQPKFGGDRLCRCHQSAMTTDCSFGLSGRAAGVVHDRTLIDAGEIDQRYGTSREGDRKQVAAKFGLSHGERHLELCGRAVRKFCPTLTVGLRVDNQSRRLDVLDHRDMVGERAERMQPGDQKAKSLRSNTRAPGFGAIGAQERHDITLPEAGLNHSRLQAGNQSAHRGIAEAAAAPHECFTLRKPRQRAQNHRRRRRREPYSLVHSSPPMRSVLGVLHVGPHLAFQRPRQTGLRFSAKARRPSARSSASKATAAIGDCRLQASWSVQLAD
jgi:hypothetical protein